MEIYYLVEKINEQGKKIKKEVPASMLSDYLGTGWKRVEADKPIIEDSKKAKPIISKKEAK